jgi:hypothetical protein
MEDTREISEAAFENPYVDIESLSFLERKVNSDKVTATDIERLDLILRGYGFKEFIISRFMQLGISSYKDYIQLLSLEDDYQSKLTKSTAKGIILGSIGALKEILFSFK